MSKFIMFPGQGSQSVGMGGSLYQNSTKAKELYDLADKLFQDYYQNCSECNAKEEKITEISFTDRKSLINNTKYTQPCILVHSMTVWEEALANGIIQANKIKFLAGHSLGEFSALYAAGVLSAEDVIKLVIKRADLMSQAKAGSMTAILGIDGATIEQEISEFTEVSIANYNSSEQVVITGEAESILKANKKIEEFAINTKIRAKIIPLPVSGAFHSSLMNDASKEFTDLINKANFNDAKFEIIQNFDANAHNSASKIKENLIKQMTGSVQWAKTVELAIKNGSSEALEFGPGKVLSGLIKKYDRRFPVKSFQNIEDLQASSIV